MSEQPISAIEQSSGPEAAQAQRSGTRGARIAWSLLRTFLLALVMGAAGGAGCTFVRLGFRGLQWCFTGHSGMPPDAAASLSFSWRITVPIIGGALGWLVLWLYRRSGRAQRPVDYVEAVRVTGGEIPFTATAMRTLSSAFSVATGAAIGREGSMIQFATAVCAYLGSRLEHFSHRCRPADGCEHGFSLKKSHIEWNSAGHSSGRNALSARQSSHIRSSKGASGVAALLQAEPFDAGMRSRIVTYGVAAGVAAAYQAPIAGAFFASEIAIGATRLKDLPALLLASITGWLVSRPLLGPGPLFPAPAAIGAPAPEWLWLLPMAVLLGVLGPGYQWLIRRSLRVAQRLPVSFAWGGTVVGLLSLATPLVWGNGDRALFTLTHVPAHGSPGYLPGLLMVTGILAARLLATCFCVGAGVAGGVFTPTLFAGASAGMVIALCVHAHTPILFVAAGISCLLAAVTHAPLMTSFMTVELTGKWSLLPLFYLMSWIAWNTAGRLSANSLYAIATNRPANDTAHGRSHEAANRDKSSSR